MADKEIKVKVSTEADTKAIERLTSLINDIKSEKVDLDVNADDSEIKTAKKEIDDIQGEKVDVDIDVDDSEIKSARKELEDLHKEASSNISATGNAITGVVSGLAGKSIWDTVYGTSKKAETNKILIKNMGDASKSAEDLYNTIDTTTDKSLISMQQLIPALNGIKSATGASANEIDTASSKVASFGQYVYAMTGSEAKAEQAMFDLSKGIKGAYASLDQYGITEDALMRTGLWSGKEDDLNGYLDAVNEVTGSTDELMNSTQGLEALMGKSFSRAGKKMGETILPIMKTLLSGFNTLDSATDGWLSTAILAGGGVASSMVGAISAFNQINMAIPAIQGGFSAISTALAGISLGPILLVVGAVIALGIAIYEVGKYFGWWTDVSSMFEAIWAGIQRIWSAFINHPDIQALCQMLMQAWNAITPILNQVWQWILKVFNAQSGSKFDAVRAFINAVGIAWQAMTAPIRLVIAVVRAFVGAVQSGVATAKSAINSISSAWHSVKNTVTGTGSAIASAVAKPFIDAWNRISPYIDKIKSGISYITSAGGAFGGGDEAGWKPKGNRFNLDTSIDSSGYITTSRESSSKKIANNITLNVGSVDKKERVDEIIDAVRRELQFDNETAGRTVG